MTPEVTVVLPVRDGARWIGDAVASVVRQTLEDWELVVVDDGSTDVTPQILDLVLGVAGSQFRHAAVVIRNPKPEGVAGALNAGIAVAGAQLIARLDADDWMRPDRLERQVGYLRDHPEVGLLGSATVEVGPGGERYREYPMTDRQIRRALPWRNPICHPAAMFRREIFERAGGYCADFQVAQDLDLWLRIAPLTKMANLAGALTVRRIHPGQVSAQRKVARRMAQAKAIWRALKSGTVSPVPAAVGLTRSLVGAWVC